MERMTFREGDGIACVRDNQCFEEQSGHYCGPAIDRLAAYEDTGMPPEEITAMQHTLDEYHKVADPLLRAQADGRLVVLPCKVGDTVWITGSVRRLYSEKIRTFFCGDPSYGRGMADNGVKMIRTTGCDIPFHEFGKSVFLTREEAEKALEAMK